MTLWFHTLFTVSCTTLSGKHHLFSNLCAFIRTWLFNSSKRIVKAKMSVLSAVSHRTEKSTFKTTCLNGKAKQRAKATHKEGTLHWSIFSSFPSPWEWCIWWHPNLNLHFLISLHPLSLGGNHSAEPFSSTKVFQAKLCMKLGRYLPWKVYL